MDTSQRQSEQGHLSSAKVTCSFSIEHILKQDKTRDQQTTTDSGNQERNRENPEKHFPHEECISTISPSSSPLRSYPVHPICPIPATAVIHPDSYYSYCMQRNAANCCTISPLHKRSSERNYWPRNNAFAYVEETYRYIRDRDLPTAISGLNYKQHFDAEEKHNSKRKGGQIRFSHVQSVELERIFNHQKYISPQERKQLSHYLHLSERQVKTWFQNRRAKWRRIKMEAEMRRRMTRDSVVKLKSGSSSEKMSEISLSPITDNDY